MDDQASRSDRPSVVEARFEATGNFPQLLDQLGVSLLVSTYQAGKLLVLGTHRGQLTVTFNNFDRIMGIAAGPEQIAIGSRSQIWYMRRAEDLAERIEPAGRHDACFLTRSSHVIGEIQGHDLAWSGDELWVVNTLFSCLCTVDPEYSFVPRWQPPFVSALASEDRCHLNGLALENGRPEYVTALAESDTAGGWRPTKATSGCLLNVPSDEVVARGLCMPHSPRLHEGNLFVLDSGHGRLSHVDRRNGQVTPVTQLPGYTRGVSFYGPYAFIGLSRIRETSVFGGIPIAAEREHLKCGVAVVDLRSGQFVSSFVFESGVTEIFSVEVLADTRCPATVGPFRSSDEGLPIWYAPGPVPIQEWATDGADEVDTLVCRGDDHKRRAEWAAAAACYRQALRLQPGQAEVAGRLGEALQDQGRRSEAAAAYEQSLKIRADQPEVLIAYGGLLRESDRPDEARAMYQRALEVEPENPYIEANLAQMLNDEGLVDDAAVHFARSNRIRPIPKAAIAAATLLPPVYQSMDDLIQRRQRLIDNIAALQADEITMDPTVEIVPHLFYPVYQGFNDVEIQRGFARVYRPPAEAVAPLPLKRDGKIRLGLISAFFTNHTIGRLNRGLVEQLDREKFHVTVLSTSVDHDAIAQAFQEHADTYLVIPQHLPAARRQIRQLDLDILLYADIGMSAFTYSLAFSRLAPVQCVTWGHPQTTGIPTIDYFLSGDVLDTEDGQQAFTEKLIRLRGMQTYYHRPEKKDPVRDRAYFHLPQAANLYGCPQSLFKFHPEFDDVLAGILRSDSEGLLVALEGRYRQWTELLEYRWRETMPDVFDRIRFLPRMSHDDFLHLTALCDVLLDPLHFGGGNSSFEALAVGTPVVTLPTDFLRGRITLAQYQMMGLLDCVVDSKDDYVVLANRIGTDADYRRDLSQRITETTPSLFENTDSIRAIEEFLESVVS